MGQSGGGGNDLLNGIASVVSEIPNATTNIVTGGLVGYDNESGSFTTKRGVVMRAADEALGEISGRNMMRDQAWITEKRIKEEEAQRAKDLAAEAEKKRLEDVGASYAAAGARNTSRSRGNKSLVYQPLGEQTDFLGL